MMLKLKSRAKPTPSGKSSAAGRDRTKPIRVLKGPEVRQRLLDSATNLLQSHAISRITTNMILREAGVARGSLYHHFEGSTQLLESALLRIFSRHVSLNIEMLRGAITDARDLRSFLTGLQRITRISQGPDRRASRFDRVRLIAATQNNETLGKLLAKEQARLTDAITEIFKLAQQKGWIRPDIPAGAAAVFIQSYTLGKIVDDLVPNPVESEDWNTLIDLFVERTLISSQEST
jgi:AcrR family transcriptional regulator